MGLLFLKKGKSCDLLLTPVLTDGLENNWCKKQNNYLMRDILNKIKRNQKTQAIS